MTGREQELRALAASPDFSELLETDPVIRELDAQRRSKPIERLLLVEALGGALLIGGVPSSLALTPAKWAVLYSSGNGFACHGTQITLEHVDQFFWMLTHALGELDGFDSLPEKAKDYCSSVGTDREEVIDDLIQAREMAFYALRMLPPVQGEGVAPEYDVEWLTRICCAAHEASGIPVPDLIHNTALSTVCFFYVHQQRKNDVKGLIRKPSDQEIDAAIMARTNELAKEFLKNGR